MRQRSLIFRASAALASIAVLASETGCGVLSTEPYKETTVYDLGVPENVNKSSIPVSIGRFRMDGPYKSRMVLRSSGNKLKFNDYKKWARSPELMLSRYLKLALNTYSDTPGNSFRHYAVDGTIFVFEADEASRSVRLVVAYSIKKTGRRDHPVASGRASFTTKIDQISSDSISNAMSANAARFAELIVKELAKNSHRK